MPYIFWCEVFAFKNMTQMAAAMGANDLHPPAVGIRNTLHCAWYFIVKTGPAAMRFELRFGGIKRCVAAPANVQAFSLIV